jgi:hypothetical protein
MDRRLMGAVWAVASTLAGTAAADVTPRALARLARTPESRCASAMCQNMTDDSQPAPAPAADADEPPPFSIAFGLGASWFRLREATVYTDLVLEGNPRPSDVIGSGGVEFPPERVETKDDVLAAYPTLSVTIDLQQPLVSIGSLDLRIAERFSIASAPRVPNEDLSTIVGFADIVLGVHVPGFPVQAGLGPALGVADVQTERFSWGASLLVGALGIVRVELPGLPGTLDAVVRDTRLATASAGAGSYRDAQLAFTLAL